MRSNLLAHQAQLQLQRSPLDDDASGRSHAVGRRVVCGIAGVVGVVGPRERDAVRRMCVSMRHRGPDDEGFFDTQGASLGMRRLAIVDVAHGHQPVFDESGSVAVVFNGEIYNFGELRRGLIQRGHRLLGSSDSECLPHLYEEEGGALVQQLRGMFSLAVWDSARAELFLARDRLGKKPLYYWVDGPRLWFASELKCLMSVPHCPTDIDPVAVDQYLTYQYVPQPRTILAGVSKLAPGHTLTWRGGRVVVKRYWTLDYQPLEVLPSPRELSQQLRDQLLDATRIRMTSERPLGAFLSGGLDSSAVVAAMARVSNGPVSTFSVGFEEEAFNELPHARRVADMYGTNHHELIVTPDIADILPRIVEMFDEPFADSSAVPSYYVAEMARRDVVVVLNGDGGDETFGGYTRYSRYMRRGLPGRRLPRGLTWAMDRAASDISRMANGNQRPLRLAGVLGRMAEPDPSRRYARMVSYFLPGERAALYRTEFAERIAGHDPYDLIADAWRRAPEGDTTNRLLATDVATYLPGDLLSKVDITTMAVSLEARSPLLDQELMQWAARLPGHLKVRGKTTKFLFKQAMRPWLPDDLIHRQKMGFAIPRAEWLRGPLQPLIHDTLLAPDSRIATYIQPQQIQQWVQHSRTTSGAASQVWALLMLELWHRAVR